MSEKIMIITHGSAFMTNALTAALKKTGFETLTAEPDIESIRNNIGSAKVIIFYAGEFVFDKPEILVYLKDICAGEKKPLIIVGYEKELTEIKAAIPGHLISNEFLRPFDMKLLTEAVSSLSEEKENITESKHILLVDDDASFLNMMQDWLSQRYNVTSVRSGMQAITYIASHKPDLILLDHDMPITSGPQVMQMIRSEPNSADIPIIFLTGKSDRESVMKVMQLKPQGYLLKSTKKEEIVEAIEHFFETDKWNEILEMS